MLSHPNNLTVMGKMPYLTAWLMTSKGLVPACM